MDASKLAVRSSGGPLVPLSARRAVAPGWALAFDVPAMAPVDPLMASVMPQRRPPPSAGDARAPPSPPPPPVADVHGVVYAFSAADWARLVASEGGDLVYAPVPLRVVTYEGDAVTAMAFQARQPLAVEAATARAADGHGGGDADAVAAAAGSPAVAYLPRHVAPSTRYAALLVAGATAARLDPTYVAALGRLPVTPPLPVARGGPRRLAAAAARAATAAQALGLVTLLRRKARRASRVAAVATVAAASAGAAAVAALRRPRRGGVGGAASAAACALLRPLVVAAGGVALGVAMAPLVLLGVAVALRRGRGGELLRRAWAEAGGAPPPPRRA